MQVRGPLTIEHRLIEQMLEIIKKVKADVASEKRIDPVFVDTVVDFLQIYADKTQVNSTQRRTAVRLESVRLTVKPDFRGKMGYGPYSHLLEKRNMMQRKIYGLQT